MADRDPSLAATELEVTAPSASGASAELPVGTQVSRYVILGVVGRGAMGVVYSAFDPKLDRKVALKLLRGELAWSGNLAVHDLLLREARSLAQLRHPNVLAVHDVGEHAGSLFIAMEFVEGQTLTRWLMAQPRTLREILQVFRDAGHGLAAAHRAGLVHRDFKPDNVLVGHDGLVRVADFGLARRVGPGEGMAVAGLSNAPLEASGQVVGTPVYMGPEVLTGHAATAQSDQFAFCASLWEALHGERPFEGATLPDLLSAASSGSFRPQKRRLPRRVRQALVRGLDADPAHRFKDLDELLSHLGRPPKRVRGVFLAAGLAVGLVAGAIATARWLQQRREAHCDPVAAKAALLPVAQRRQIDQRFARSPVPYAATAWGTARGELDGWLQGWAGRYQAACLAIAREGGSPDPAVHAQLACLERQSSNFRALRDELVNADEPAVRNVVYLAELLPSAGDCRTVGELGEPADPKARAVYHELEPKLQRAELLYDEGRYDESSAAALEAAHQAHEAALAPVEAQAKLLAGRSDIRRDRSSEARAELESALRLAESTSSDSTVASARLELFEQAATSEADLPRAEALLPEVRAAIDRIGAPAAFEAEYESSRAHLALHRGDDAAAISLLEQALILYGKSRGRRSIGFANQMYDLALAYNRLGKHAEAQARLEEALRLYRELLGAEHPSVAKALDLQAGIASDAGKNDDAIALLAQVLHIYELNHLTETSDYAAVLYNLGILHQRQKHYQEAERVIRQAIALNDRIKGSPLDRAQFYSGLAETLQDEGDLKRALEAVDQSVALKEQVLGKDSPRLAMTLVTRAGILTSLHRAPAAVADLERALSLMNEGNSSPVGRAVARFELARALYEVPGSKKKARGLAQQVRDFFAGLGAPFADNVAEADTWLKEHP